MSEGKDDGKKVGRYIDRRCGYGRWLGKVVGHAFFR